MLDFSLCMYYLPVHFVNLSNCMQRSAVVSDSDKIRKDWQIVYTYSYYLQRKIRDTDEG
jgi:hypothetical protein